MEGFDKKVGDLLVKRHPIIKVTTRVLIVEMFFCLFFLDARMWLNWNKVIDPVKNIQ